MNGTVLHTSILTLNVNSLNAPLKRYRLTEGTKNHKPNICCLQETYLTCKDSYKLKVEGWKKRFCVTGNQKQDKPKIRNKSIPKTSKSSYSYIRQNGL